MKKIVLLFAFILTAVAGFAQEPPTLVKVEYTPGWEWLGWLESPYTGNKTHDAYYIYAVRERLFSDGSEVKDTIYNHTNFLNDALSRSIQYDISGYANYRVLADEDQYDLTHAIRKVSIAVKDLPNISINEVARSIEKPSSIYCDKQYSIDEGWYRTKVNFDCRLIVKTQDQNLTYSFLLQTRPSVARLHYLTLDGQTVYFPETTYDVKITEEDISETDEFGPGKRISYIVEYVLLGKTFYAGCELTVYQEKNHTVDGLTYNVILNSDNEPEAVVTQSVEKLSGDFVVPDYVTIGSQKLTVTSIGSGAFAGQEIESATIGDNVRSIGANAFSGCSQMEWVEMGKSVSRIGNRVFYNCTSLMEFISYAKTPPYADDEMFYNVPAACVLKVPAGSTDTYSWSSGWRELKNIVALPYTVGDTFQVDGFTMKVTATQPTKRVEIVKYCGAQTRAAAGEVEIPARVKDENGYKYNVVAIGAEAFAGHTEITSVTIPATVTSIGDHAFADCPNLGLVVIENSTPQRIEMGEEVFDPSASAVLVVPEGSLDAFSAADQWSAFQSITTEIPSAIHSIITSTHTPAFNLMGQKVGEGFKGIVIENGRKVLKK